MRTPPPSGRQLHLAAHDQEIVAVEVGGGLRVYRVDGRDVLDPYALDRMVDGARGQFLAPWPNRLAGGSFDWDGEQLQTALTEPAARNAIHGLVRWANWEVPDSTPQPWGPQTPADSTSLTYTLHPQPGWPWTIELRVSYRLVAGGGLEVRSTARNVSERPCPIGFGWHPYLKGAVDDARVTLPASSAYHSDDRGIPTGRFDVAGTEFDFRTPRRIGGAKLDIAFTDLERDGDGRARLVFEPDGAAPVTLWMDANYTHVMLFTGDTLPDSSRRRQALAVEPMTGAPDFLNNHDGLRVLDPGAAFEAAWGIDPFSNS